MKVNNQSQLYQQINPQDMIASQNAASNNFDFNINIAQNDFNSIMKSTEVAAKQTAFENLIEKLSKQEKAIFKNPSISNINAYKSIVTEIMQLGSQNFKTHDMELYTNSGYLKFVSASEVIDSELQSLFNEFLETNSVTMNMIDSFANIKGLLFEIFI